MASEDALVQAKKIWNGLDSLHVAGVDAIANIIDELTKPNLYLATNKELLDELNKRLE